MENPKASQIEFGVCSKVECKGYDKAMGCVLVPGKLFNFAFHVDGRSVEEYPMGQVKDDNALCKTFSCSKRFY